MKRLAIITTHPIQYNAPLFGLLAQQKNRAIKVFYTFPQAAKIVEDKGFGKKIEWDIPLLSGYDYSFVENTAKTPSLLKFNGIHNPTLIQEIENWKADAVLVYGWNFRSHLAAMRHFKGKIHVLFRGDSTLLDEKPNVRTLLRRLWLKFVFQYVDTALYTGTHNKEYYLKHGLLPHQLHFAPHAIDNQRFEKFDPQFLENWKQILNILPQNEQITLLFAGKFESKKNPALLIEAVKQFGANTFFLIMVGSGELESELKKMVENMPNVVFLPFQNQQKMPYTYRLADVYVLPSSGPNETWGLAVNEAMACGKAVLVSNKCGCAVDLVENNRNGFIFEANNSTDLIDKLQQIVNQKDKLMEWGDFSKQKIKNWSYTQIVDALINSTQ